MTGYVRCGLMIVKAISSLHRSLIDHCGLVAPHLFCAELHYQLLCLVDIQKEVVLLKPGLQSINLLQVSSLIIRDQAYHNRIVSKLDDGSGV